MLFSVTGANGAVYGTPYVFFEQNLKNITTPTAVIPNKPNVPPATINTSLSIIQLSYRSGTANEHSPVAAMISTTGALIRPADTEISPITRPPTMLTA